MGRAKKNVEVEAQVIARGNVVPMMTEAESAETVQYCLRRGCCEGGQAGFRDPDDYGTDETGRPVQLNRDRPAPDRGESYGEARHVGNVA